MHFQPKLYFINDIVTYNQAKKREQRNDKSTSKNIFSLKEGSYETTFSANLSKTYISLHLHIINTKNYRQICKVN